jgi:hypothetical protein
MMTFRQLPFVSHRIGRWVFVQEANAEGLKFKVTVLRKIHAFTEFAKDTDPYGTQEMGGIKVTGKRVWWQINLYDENY